MMRAPRTVITTTMIIRLAAMWNEGAPLRVIAAAIKVPVGTARRVKKRAVAAGMIQSREIGRPKKRQMTTEERRIFDAKVAQMDSEGLTVSAISHALGCKREAVETAMDRNAALKRAQVKLRPCIKCREPMHSESPGHRYCDGCRRHAAEYSHLWGVSL